MVEAQPSGSTASRVQIARSRVTIGLLIANIGVFIWLAALNGDAMDMSGELLFDHGSNNGVLVAQGEWWRLVTCMFLHGGLVHVAVNMWSLWALGPFVEALFGSAAMLAIYMLAGIGGSIASCLWHPLGNSVGASGAIFGLFGAIIAFFLSHRRSMPSAVFWNSMARFALLLAINGYLGLRMPNIDNAGHVGGLLFGIVCGFAAWRARGTPATLDTKRAVRLGLVAIALGALVFLVPWRVRVEEHAYLRAHPELLRPR
jgi:rhomboid protease GluP